MGCLLSKLHFECPRANPRIFQVWNIDSEGRNVKPGKIEITEAQLILYQKGDITVRWPLRSLRRYGFDAELFSFECGRRCPTGPGVYAFRCHRAEVLFNILQENIQNCGGGPANISIATVDEQINLETNAITVTSMPSNGSSASGSAGSRLVSSVDSAGYLEPIRGGSNHRVQCPNALNSSPQNFGNVSATLHSSSDGSVCVRPAVTSCGNTSVEWSTGLPPNIHTCCTFGFCTHTSHNYVNDSTERMNSTSPYSHGVCVAHQYVNSSVLDHSSRSYSAGSRHDQSGNACVSNAAGSPSATIHPGGFPRAMNCVDFNTNYAKLDDLLKQEQSVKRHKEEEHCYVNVKPENQLQNTAGNVTNSKCISDRPTPLDYQSQSETLFSEDSGQVSSRLYVNLRSSSDNPVTDVQGRKASQSMNYAVLDLDQNSEAQGNGSSVSVAVSQASTLPIASVTATRTPEGYAQIDFDRTAALSNSANPCPFNEESIRKTRHNAITPCSGSPS